MTLDELISQPRLGADPAAIASAEARTGFRFGPRLRALVRRCDGAHLVGVLHIPDGSTSGALELLPLERMIRTTLVMLGSRSDVIVCARDGSGNAIVVDSHDAVFFWDHDTDELIPFGCDLDGLWRFFTPPPVVVRKPEPWDGFFEALERDAPADALDSAIGSATTIAPDDGTHAPATILRYCNNRAAPYDRVEHLTLLEERGARGEDLLHAASRCGAVAWARHLLRRGVSPDVRGRDGTTPLMQAAIGGHLAVIELLLEAGADRSATTGRGRTALQMAVTAHQAAAAKRLGRE